MFTSLISTIYHPDWAGPTIHLHSWHAETTILCYDFSFFWGGGRPKTNHADILASFTQCSSIQGGREYIRNSWQLKINLKQCIECIQHKPIVTWTFTSLDSSLLSSLHVFKPNYGHSRPIFFSNQKWLPDRHRSEPSQCVKWPSEAQRRLQEELGAGGTQLGAGEQEFSQEDNSCYSTPMLPVEPRWLHQPQLLMYLFIHK